MKGYFICFTLELALTVVMATVSADACAAGAVGTVRATVITPVSAGSTLDTFSTSAFVSGVTAGLTIHVRGVSQSAIPEHLNSVPFELFSIAESVCPNDSAMAGCLDPEGGDGLLQGDPVHDILLNMVTHSTSGKGSLSLSLSYN